MMLQKLIHHPEGGDPLSVLASLLDDTDIQAGQVLIVAHEGSIDPLPAIWGKGVRHFFSLSDPVKALELASLIESPVLIIIGRQFSALFSGGSEGGEVALMEKLFTGSSPEYLELLEDAFPSMFSESLSGAGVEPAAIECVAASLPSQRLSRRLPRYLKGTPPDVFRYVEEARKLGLGPTDMAAYTLGRCLGEGSGRTLFVGLSEWGLLISLPRWSK